jgi:hypothetical protein
MISFPEQDYNIDLLFKITLSLGRVILFHKMLKKYFKIISVSILLLFVIISSIFYFSSINKQEIINKNTENIVNTKKVESIENIENPEKTNDEISVSLIVGEKTIVLNTKAGNSFYEALVEAREKNLIDFAGQNYPALGFFLTDIGSLHSDNDKDLMYYINGKEAYLGVSSYKLKDGDILKWQLE